MSTAKFIVNLMTYADTYQTNDPLKAELDWAQEWDETVSKPTVINAVTTPSTNTTITINSGNKWLAIWSDQLIYAKLNGATENKLPINPSVAGTQDGFLLVRGTAIDSLVLNTPGATAANVKIFLCA